MGDGASFGFSNSATNASGQSWDTATARNPYGKQGTDPSGGFLNGKGPQETATIFSNWLTGGPKPAAIDPSVGISQANANAGVDRLGAQGMGMGGLFGLGKLNMFSPLQPGVPSSTPAMPSMPSGNPFSGGR